MAEQKKKKKKGGSRDWSGLPQELLEVVVSQADDISDIIRLGAVCKSWRSAAKSPVHLRRQRPWMLIETSKQWSRSFVRFCDPWNKRHYNLGLENLVSMGSITVYVSHYGWLVIKQHFSGNLRNNLCRAVLLNPITKAQINLPPWPRGFYVPIITSNPSSKDCLIICTSHRSIIFCRPGDTEWTSWVDKKSCTYFLHKFAYCLGKVYIWHQQQTSLEVGVCDHIALPEEEATLIPSLQLPGSFDNVHLFSAPTGGCLLLLTHKVHPREPCTHPSEDTDDSSSDNGSSADDDDFKDCDDENVMENSSVCVFKADLHEPQPKWSQIQNIGDASILTTAAYSLFLPTADFPSLKKNHIYYSRYTDFFETRNATEKSPVAIQNIQTNSLETFLPYSDDSFLLGAFRRVIWFTPSLC